MTRPTDDEQVDKALKFAEAAHGSQMYGVHPYKYHLVMVHNTLMFFGQTHWPLRCAGILHDTIEDTATNYADIKLEFGFEVAELVYAVTDELGRNRHERHAKTYPKIKALSGAVTLKLADRIANVEHSVATADHSKLSMYKKEHPEFVLGIGPGGPQSMWDRLNSLIA